MAGIKGRSGGHNRKPVVTHVVAGTYRPDRHGVVPGSAAAVLRMPDRAPDREPVPAVDRRRVLRGLGQEGARLARRLLDDFGGWTAADLVTLRRLAATVNRLAALDAAITRDGGPVMTTKRGARPHPLLPAVRAETRTLMALYRLLDLREED